MNNSAASCIEIGLHDRAITSLKRALRLSKAPQPSRENLCDCYRCTLDWCVIRSKTCTPELQVPPNRDEGRGAIETIDVDETEYEHRSDDENRNNRSGYIAHRPIKVKCQGHAMGPALYLIITFNLALANHLIAIGNRNNVSERNRTADRARELYKLTYKMQANLLQHESQRDPSTVSPAFTIALRSIRFEMIILNNISQVYNLTENVTERDRCLERLLSTMMIVVDHNVRILGTDQGEGTVDQMWEINMDCFLLNTTDLVLRPSYTSNAA